LSLCTSLSWSEDLDGSVTSNSSEISKNLNTGKDLKILGNAERAKYGPLLTPSAGSVDKQIFQIQARLQNLRLLNRPIFQMTRGAGIAFSET
jgi:hypothetical protein